MRLKTRGNDWRFEPHDWFAWRPVWVHESRTWVWLETVRRRAEGEMGMWYYRLKSKP